MLDSVIKIGGSLTTDIEILRNLCVKTSELGSKFKLLVVPGGGEFADVVRSVDERFKLNPMVSHRMAILGMDQYGLLLSTLIPGCRVVFSLSVAEAIAGSGHIAVLLPSKLIYRARSLYPSWNVTSDSIAAYVAGRLGVNKLVLVTNVDGLFPVDPKLDKSGEPVQEVSASSLLEIGIATCVDRFLPNLLLKYGLDCFVVNGFFPERIENVLAGTATVSTHIVPK